MANQSTFQKEIFQRSVTAGDQRRLVTMEPGKKKAKVRRVKKKPKSLIKPNMTAEQKAEIRIKEKFNEQLDIK